MIEKDFYPFGLLRPVQELRFGYFSQEERWKQVKNLFPDLKKVDTCAQIPSLLDFKERNFNSILEIKNNVDVLINLSKIIAIDFDILKITRVSKPISNLDSKIYNPENIFFGENVVLRNCTINAEKGSVIIGDNVEIMEYAVIHGPAVIHDNSKVAPHSFFRANTVIGKNCFVAGEIKNSIVMSNSNKGHYGYLGDSIVGEYCNLGAGTTTSNLKNNFSNIKMYSSESEAYIDSGTNKLGSFIGDFSMTAINSQLNAGTTIGVHCNVFGETNYPKYLPDFSWGVKEKYSREKWRKTARQLLLHKGADQSEIQNIIGKLETLFTKTA